MVECKALHVQVTCSEPYEWKDPTEGEWEFSPAVHSLNGDKPFHVSAYFL
jgi:carbamoyl-phosphate synthase small subunit